MGSRWEECEMKMGSKWEEFEMKMGSKGEECKMGPTWDEGRMSIKMG